MSPFTMFSFPAILIILCVLSLNLCQSEAYPDLDDSDDDIYSDSSSSEEEYDHHHYDIHGGYAYGYTVPAGPQVQQQSSSTVPSSTSASTSSSTSSSPPPKPQSRQSTCNCGSSSVNTRIVGGQVSSNHAWPWMAAITNITEIPEDARTKVFSRFLFQRRSSIYCGGSIINDRYILTAAHCALGMMNAGLERFQVIVGDNKVNGSSLYRRVFKIKSTRVHPKYMDLNFEKIDYDAALLELDNTMVFNNNILPICLGQAGSPYVKRIATVAGWGNVVAGDGSVYRPSNYLMDVNVQIITNKQCNQSYATAESSPKGISPSMMCAKTLGKDSCGGDSGGPLFLRRSSSSQSYKQIAIVSYGEGCGTTYPGVYTRVQKILSWVMAFTKDANYCSNSFSP